MGIKSSIAGVSVAVAVLAGALALIAVSGAAGASSERGKAVAMPDKCVSTQISRSEIINDHTLKIQDAAGRVAMLTLTGPCLKERSDGVALQFAPLVDSVCRPEDVSVIARPADIAPLTCNVTSIQFVKS